jgi:hypothetical protein
VGVLLALVGALHNPHAAAASAGRVYLLGSETNFLYWSTDDRDPNLQVPEISWQCGAAVSGTPAWSPCATQELGPADYVHALRFLPAAIVQPPQWSPERPLRFTLDLAVDSRASATVHLGLLAGGAYVESAPATEVQPGLWQGQLDQLALMDPTLDNGFFVVVRTSDPTPILNLGMQGSSYVDFPAPLHGMSAHELRFHDKLPPGKTPQTLTTGQRSFTFDDPDWQVHEFRGDLTVIRNFEVVVPRDGAFVLAWIEMFDSAMVEGASRGNATPAQATETGRIKLFHNGQLVSAGSNSAMSGRGADTTIMMNPTPGTLRAEVTPLVGSRDRPYRLYVLTVFGNRSLRSMRWRVTPQTPFGIGISAWTQTCGVPSEPIPVTEEVATLTVGFEGQSPNPAAQRWTPGFSLPGTGAFPCGEMGDGPSVDFTIPRERVMDVSAVPARSAPMASFRDTTLEMHVEYWYLHPSIRCVSSPPVQDRKSVV